MDDFLKEAWGVIEQAEDDLYRNDLDPGDQESLRDWLKVMYSKSADELRIWGAHLRCLDEGIGGDSPEGTA